MLSPDTVLQAITLSRTGTIAGTVPDTVNGARVLFADIAIKGSPFFCRALAQEPFAMSLVPEGAYRIRVLYNANDSIRNEPMLVTIVKTLPVFPSVNDTTIVDIR
jgi:hypothetical protein